MLQQQGENICVPELLEMIAFMGRGWGGGRGAGSGAVEGCACREQMEHVPITGDGSQS